MLDLIKHREFLKDNLAVRAFGLAKVPLLFFIDPTVVDIDDQKVVFKVPFHRRNKNHLGSMYFGTLCCGADLAGGYMAMRKINQAGHKVSLVFKDMQADFLKRAEGDTFFTCEEGDAIADMIEETVRTGERVNRTMSIIATCPDKLGDEPVAKFALTLSLKAKKRS